MEYCERVGGNRNSAKGMFETLINDGSLVQQIGGKTGTALLLYIKGNEPKPEATPECHFCNNAYHGCQEYVDVDGTLCAKCEKDGGWYYATRPATEKSTEALWS